MKWKDVKNSKFLKQDDVDGSVQVTISGYEKVNVAMEGAEQEMKYAIHFKELEKPMILNQTNASLLEYITGSEDSEDSIGLKVELCVDPNIMFGGKRVGGLRIKPIVPSKPVASPVQEKEKPTIGRPADNLQDKTDMLMKYNVLPKPTLDEQVFIKKICKEVFSDIKCEIDNRLSIWEVLKKWPETEEECQQIIADPTLIPF